MQEKTVLLADEQQDKLNLIVHSRSAGNELIRRAEIIVASENGESGDSVARRLGVSKPTVWYWRMRWYESGIVGLYGKAIQRKVQAHNEEDVANVLCTTFTAKPPIRKNWTLRSISEATGIPKSSIARVFEWFEISLGRDNLTRLSTNLLFIDRLMFVAGLYLNLPEHIVALGVDQNYRIKANEHAKRAPPLGPGYTLGDNARFLSGLCKVLARR